MLTIIIVRCNLLLEANYTVVGEKKPTTQLLQPTQLASFSKKKPLHATRLATKLSGNNSVDHMPLYLHYINKGAKISHTTNLRQHQN